MLFDPFSWLRRSNSTPPSVEPPMQPVAGRRQGSCPQPRGQWAARAWLADRSVNLIQEARDEAQQEVNASLARSGSTSSRLRQLWTRAPPPGPPLPEIIRTYDRDVHGLHLFPVHSPSNGGAFTPSMPTHRTAEHERAGWRLGMIVLEHQDIAGFPSSSSPNSNVAEAGSLRSSRSEPYPDSPTFPGHHVFPTPDSVPWPFFGSGPSSPEPEEDLDEESDGHQYDYSLWDEARRRVLLVTGGDHEALRSCTATLVNTTPTSGRSSSSETLVATPRTLSLALEATFSSERTQQEEDREAEETVVVRSVRVTRVGPPVLVDMSQLNRNQVEETDLGSVSLDDLYDDLSSHSSS
ncbi:hypothetical protein FSARC_9252 [Fusarium sarcochroum]|uniref:Uncharacterized protein n=1 Tax=Fusarium sarcochroum TaxID=1208366 RepID=A0A8H4TRB5_9HYPO|nr:hypothetical protein FSARC_9252 [Fusarium sarcochroum]